MQTIKFRHFLLNAHEKHWIFIKPNEWSGRSSSGGRVDALGIGLAVVLAFNGLQLLAIKPKRPEPVELSGPRISWTVPWAAAAQLGKAFRIVVRVFQDILATPVVCFGFD